MPFTSSEASAELTQPFPGNLYVANAQGNNVAKFRPKKNADPAKLVGQPFVLPAEKR